MKNNPLSNKKWNSFEDMKEDSAVKDFIKSNRTDRFALNNQHKAIVDNFEKIIEDVKSAKNSSDFFSITCRLSSLIEKLDNDSLKIVFVATNLYVVILNAVFRNIKVQQELIKVSENEISKFSKETDNLNLESKIFLNSAISLAFFPIAAGLNILKEHNISFLRENLTDLVKFILKNSTGNNTFLNISFKLESISWNNSYQYKGKFPVLLNDKKLFDTLRIGRSISGMSFLSLTINPALSSQFSKIENFAEADDFKDDFNLSKSLSRIYGVIYKIEETERSYYSEFPENISNQLRTFFEVFIRNNERNLIFVLKKICAGFQFQKEKRFFEVVLEKIKMSDILRKEITDFAQENLKAFKGEIGDTGYEWSNKVFIVSLKLLSILSVLNQARDDKWKVSTTVHEFIEWIKDIDYILNKYSVEDDWASIRNYINQENTEIEWKSTFFTPLEQEFINETADSAIGKKIFEGLVKAILGMLNTKGGVVIVGLIENPGLVVRKEYYSNIIHKNDRSFFDIFEELKKTKRNLDSVRLQIFERLKTVTDNSVEKFNDLIKLEPLSIKEGQSIVRIVKIDIKKSDKPFFNVKKEGESLVWLSLTMRAEGQTVDVDIRDYIKQ